MLKSGFEMKIQMRGGDYIVHTVLVRILALSCQYNKLCFIAFRISGGYIPPRAACYLLAGCHSVIRSIIE